MIPSPKKPNLAMSALYAAPGMCDNLHSMKPAVLVTKRIFPEAIAYLKEHAELDYAESDDGMSAGELAARIRGKQAVVSQLMDKFSPEVLASLDGMKAIANVAVAMDQSVQWPGHRTQVFEPGGDLLCLGKVERFRAMPGSREITHSLG